MSIRNPKILESVPLSEMFKETIGGGPNPSAQVVLEKAESLRVLLGLAELLKESPDIFAELPFKNIDQEIMDAAQEFIMGFNGYPVPAGEKEKMMEHLRACKVLSVEENGLGIRNILVHPTGTLFSAMVLKIRKDEGYKLADFDLDAITGWDWKNYQLIGEPERALKTLSEAGKLAWDKLGQKQEKAGNPKR